MFELLKNEFLADRERVRKERAFFIENGFCENWHEENKKFSDDGIRRYSTETRWSQYQAGTITREKAVSFAVKRMEKEIEKDIAKGLEKLQEVEKAPDLNYASIDVEFVRSSMWGYNPKVEVVDGKKRTFGTASGCGYDKESAAVASAFNSNPSFLKVLYTLKEKGLAAGQTSESKTACTGHDNRNIIGYGAGYSVLPYFEGGVGVNCYWHILEKAGFEVSCHYGKRENYYHISKKAGAENA